MKAQVYGLFIVPLAGIVALSYLESRPSSIGQHRVAVARKHKQTAIRAIFEAKKVKYPPDKLYIRAHKAERELEIWAKSGRGWMSLIKTYPIAAMSGNLGPKRKEGDLQVPEGLYEVDRLNPFSKFLLSFGINYPNKSDKILGDPKTPGGDIFIHGGTSSIGCLAMTDDAIEEIYLMVLDASSNLNYQVRVDIFPFRMTKANMEKYSKGSPHSAFWKQLSKHWFEIRIVGANNQTYIRPESIKHVQIDESGNYYPPRPMERFGDSFQLQIYQPPGPMNGPYRWPGQL